MGKQDASYWLGLIAFEQGNFPSAIDYFTKRTLDAMPGGPWTQSRPDITWPAPTRHPAIGSRPIKEYRPMTISPSRYGNLLRARWLEEQKKRER